MSKSDVCSFWYIHLLLSFFCLSSICFLYSSMYIYMIATQACMYTAYLSISRSLNNCLRDDLRLWFGVSLPWIWFSLSLSHSPLLPHNMITSVTLAVMYTNGIICPGVLFSLDTKLRPEVAQQNRQSWQDVPGPTGAACLTHSRANAELVDLAPQPAGSCSRSSRRQATVYTNMVFSLDTLKSGGGFGDSPWLPCRAVVERRIGEWCCEFPTALNQNKLQGTDFSVPGYFWWT